MLLFVFSRAQADPPGAGCQPHQIVSPGLVAVCRQNADTLKKKKAEYEELLKKKMASMQKSASAFAGGDQTSEAAVENAKRMFSSLAAEQEALIKEVEKKRKDVASVQKNYDENIGKMMKSKTSLVTEINNKTQFIATEKKNLQALQMGRDPNAVAAINDKQKRIAAAESQLAELNKKRAAFDSAISADRGSQGQAKVLGQKFKVSESELNESATKLRGHHARLSGLSLESASKEIVAENKARDEVTAEKAKLAEMSETEGTKKFDSTGKPLPAQETGSQKGVRAALDAAKKEEAPDTADAALVDEGKKLAAEGHTGKYFTDDQRAVELKHAEQSLGTAQAGVKANEKALADIGGEKGLSERLKKSSAVYSDIEGNIDGMPSSDAEGLQAAKDQWAEQYKKDCQNKAVCNALNSYGIKPELTTGTTCVGSGICGVEKKTWDANSGLNDIALPANGEQVVKTEGISTELRAAAKQDNFGIQAASRLEQMNSDTLKSAEEVKRNAEIAVKSQPEIAKWDAQLQGNEFCRDNPAAISCQAVYSQKLQYESQKKVAEAETIRWDPVSAGEVCALSRNPNDCAKIDQNVRAAAQLDRGEENTSMVAGAMPMAGSLYDVNRAGTNLEQANAAAVRAGGKSEVVTDNLITAKEDLSSAKKMVLVDVALSVPGAGLAKGGVKAGLNTGEALTSSVIKSSDNVAAPLLKSTDNVAETVARDAKATTRLKDDLITASAPRTTVSQADQAAAAKVSAQRSSQTEANALMRQNELAVTRAEKLAAANENVRLDALRSQSGTAELKAAQAKMAQPPKVINGYTVSEQLFKAKIANTPVTDTRALVTPSADTDLGRAAGKIEQKYDAKIHVDQRMDDIDFAAEADRHGIDFAPSTVDPRNKAIRGPTIAHEIEHVKNDANLVKRVESGQEQFDWRNTSFGSQRQPTATSGYERMGIDEVPGYRRTYNSARFQQAEAIKAGDQGLARESREIADWAVNRNNDFRIEADGYLKSADQKLQNMSSTRLSSSEAIDRSGRLPDGAPERSVGVASVKVREITNGSGGSLKIAETTYKDNKRFTNLVMKTESNGVAVPMDMPVPNKMMSLPDEAVVAEARKYVAQTQSKMDTYAGLYDQSVAKRSPASGGSRRPAGFSNTGKARSEKPPVSGVLDYSGEMIGKRIEGPAKIESPELVGEIAGRPSASFTPRELAEIADRRVNWVLKEHSEFSAISSADNREFMALAARAERGEATESFFVTENAVLKRLNDDVVKDKDFVTALDNLHKEVLLREIQKDPILKDAVVASYNDYKSIGFALKKNDARIRRLLDEKITKTNNAFDEFLKKVEVAKGWKEKSIGLSSDMRTWHHSGIGKTFQEAGLAARRSRELALASGEARLVNFADEGAHYIAATDRMAARSTELAKKFKSSPMLEKTPHGTALSEEAIETIRKAKPLGKTEDDMNKAVQEALKKRYRQEISSEDAALLRSQLKDIDSVNPSLLIEKRVEINMGLHDEGVVSFDFKGQNSRNLYQTQLAILKSKGKDIKARLEAIAEGDRAATAQLDDMKARVEKAVSSLGEKYVGKDVSKVVQKSGDDGIFHPLAELGPAEKAKLAKALNEQKVGDAVRLTYLPKNYRNSKELIPTVERNRLVVEAEKIEKDLFTEHLMGELPDDVFKGLQVKVDLVPAKKGKSAVGVTFAHAEGKQIPAKAEEIARKVLEKKYDISYIDRSNASVARVPAAASRKPAALSAEEVAESRRRIREEYSRGVHGQENDPTHSFAYFKSEIKDFREANPDMPHLSDEELFSFFLYESDGYEKLNMALRGADNPAFEREKDVISGLSSLLGKMPAFEGPVARYITKLDPEALKRYNPGSLVTMPAFTSAKNGTIEELPNNFMTITSSQMAFMRIQSKTGADVSKLAAVSGQESEREIIFKPGTRFRVIRVSEIENPYHARSPSVNQRAPLIELEEIVD